MTLSIWRYAHLALAIVSSLFLLILSITGVILAYDVTYEKTPGYKTEDFHKLNLAQSLPELRKVYTDIIEINVDHNDFVSIDAIDAQGNSVKGYIHPLTGKFLGEIVPKSAFIQWTTALHRSLFLKETGRIIIGVVSFLLFLITISGTVLIVKRQQSIRHFFSKVHNDFFAQYFHVVSGRLLLLPILLLALTGTYLFMVRMDLFQKENIEIKHQPTGEAVQSLNLAALPLFKETMLSEVEKVEFPFIPDDPEEHYILKLRDRTLTVSQINGDIIAESRYPISVLLEKLSLDLHTGRTNIIWAIILGLASLNILFFIYTGFVITFKRTRTKIKNKFTSKNANIIILVGSENGSTLFFANQIHRQLLAEGKKSFLTQMNQYTLFPQAEHVLIFTSTYGLGDAPTNALHFEKAIAAYPQSQSVNFSVIGFGSTSYSDFCGYAKQIDQLLEQQKWSTRFTQLYTINDKSANEFIPWVLDWSQKSLIALATAPTLYREKKTALKKLKVISKTAVTKENETFEIVLKPISKINFQSGDLLTIYPAADNRERFYSIGSNKGNIQLMVKLFPEGLGSSYLYNLELGQTIDTKILSNPHFHFPSTASSVTMIANGTGIAPFLGMIMENRNKIPVHLYAGFRHNNSLAQHYQDFACEQLKKAQLQSNTFAFSRENNPQYVMDLIRIDAAIFAQRLEKDAAIMICGSLKMQKDVEQVLDEIALAYTNKPLQYYKDKNMILTDCY